MSIKFYILFIFSTFVFGQNQLAEVKEVEYYKIYKRYSDSDLDKAYKAIEISYNLSKKNKNTKLLAKATYGLGYCYYLYEKDSLSEVYMDEASNYAKKVNDIETLSKALNIKGSLYNYKNQKKKALKYFHESVKYSSKDVKLSNNTADVLSNIANIYVTENDTINALRYYHDAIKIQKKNKLENSLSNTYNSLGVLYMNGNQDSALYYINNALVLGKKNKLDYQLISQYLNIGIIYLNFLDTKHYDKAKLNLIEGLRLANKFNVSRYQFQGNLYLGIYYMKAEKNNVKAKKYLDNALKLLKENKDHDYNIELYKALSTVYFNLSVYKKAFFYKNLENSLKDSIFSLEKNKQIHEIQTKFDVERKDFQINLLKLEKGNKETENLWIRFTTVVGILGLLTIGLIYKSKQKKKNLLLLQEHEVKRMQDVVKSQDDERNRIAKDLHDGVGNKLSVLKHILHQQTISNEDVEFLKNGTKSLMKEVREISHDLSISLINQKPILELFVDLLDTFQNKTNIKIEFNIYPNNALDSLKTVKKIHLYRILQEVLTNIEKHAVAKQVVITVTKNQNKLTLIIEDDGKGFNLKEAGAGIGISNIKERVELIKGQLTIDTNIGNGTTIIIELDEDGDKNSVGR